MCAALVVDLHPESPDWTALAGIAAGLIGSVFGYFAGRGSDRAKRRHEEQMADVADLRAVIERVAAAEDAQIRLIDEGREAARRLAELESRAAAATTEEEAEGLRSQVDRLQALTDRFVSAERAQRFNQEVDAAMASLMTRLRGDDPIVLAHREVMRAAKDVLRAIREKDDAALDAARTEWSGCYAGFMVEAQRRLGSRLGPDRA